MTSIIRCIFNLKIEIFCLINSGALVSTWETNGYCWILKTFDCRLISSGHLKHVKATRAAISLPVKSSKKVGANRDSVSRFTLPTPNTFSFLFPPSWIYYLIYFLLFFLYCPPLLLVLPRARKHISLSLSLIFLSIIFIS